MSDEQTPQDDQSTAGDDAGDQSQGDDQAKADDQPKDDQPQGDDQGDQPSDGDKTLACEECGKDFTFTAGEQEFYEQKGFTPPKRCQECRQAKKESRRQETEVTCAGCGQQTTVPFIPTGDRPVYCRECFEKNKDQ